MIKKHSSKLIKNENVFNKLNYIGKKYGLDFSDRDVKETILCFKYLEDYFDDLKSYDFMNKLEVCSCEEELYKYIDGGK